MKSDISKSTNSLFKGKFTKQTTVANSPRNHCKRLHEKSILLNNNNLKDNTNT